jgi:DNA polymerase-3 subunit gamma/tau
LSSQPRLAVETVFFKLFQIPPAITIDRLIERLEGLRQDISKGSATGIAETSSAFGTAKKDPDPKAPEDQTRSGGQEKITTEDSSPSSGEGHRSGEEIWQTVTEQIARKYPALAPNLVHSTLKKMQGDQLEVEVKGNGFNLNMIKRQRNLAKISEVCRDVLGREMKVSISGSIPPKKKKDDERRLKQEALNDPLVTDVIEVFEGRVVDVKILSEEEKNQ